MPWRTRERAAPLTDVEQALARRLCVELGIVLDDHVLNGLPLGPENAPGHEEAVVAFLAEHAPQVACLSEAQAVLVLRYVHERALAYQLDALMAQGLVECDTTVDPPRYRYSGAWRQHYVAPRLRRRRRP